MNAIEKEVLKTIGENVDSPDVFADTAAGMDFIRDCINDAIQELSMVTGAYRIKYYLPLLADTWLYRLEWNTDYFGYVVQAWDRDRHYRLEQTDLIGLSYIDPNWMKYNGDPTHYFHIGYNMVGIYRVPSAEGKVLELDCVCVPKPYTTDTDMIKVRGNYQRACVFYAVSDFYASRGDVRRATDFYNQYIQVAQLMKLKPQSNETKYVLGGSKS